MPMLVCFTIFRFKITVLIFLSSVPFLVTGVLRKQAAVATAQVLFQRFWYVSSMKHFSIGVSGPFYKPCLYWRSPLSP